MSITTDRNASTKMSEYKDEHNVEEHWSNYQRNSCIKRCKAQLETCLK